MGGIGHRGSRIIFQLARTLDTAHIVYERFVESHIRSHVVLVYHIGKVLNLHTLLELLHCGLHLIIATVNHLVVLERLSQCREVYRLGNKGFLVSKVNTDIGIISLLGSLDVTATGISQIAASETLLVAFPVVGL